MRGTYPHMIRTISCPETRLATYHAKKAQPHQTDSLADRINADVALTDQEADSLAELLGKGCHVRTKRKIAHVCGWLVSRGDTWSCFDRVSFADGEASYCAGQSYPDEIRRLRKTVLS